MNLLAVDQIRPYKESTTRFGPTTFEGPSNFAFPNQILSAAPQLRLMNTAAPAVPFDLSVDAVGCPTLTTPYDQVKVDCELYPTSLRVGGPVHPTTVTTTDATGALDIHADGPLNLHGTVINTNATVKTDRVQATSFYSWSILGDGAFNMGPQQVVLPSPSFTLTHNNLQAFKAGLLFIQLLDHAVGDNQGDVTGFATTDSVLGGPDVYGRHLHVVFAESSVTTYYLTLKHANAGSSAGNRLILPKSTDVVLRANPYSTAHFVYVYSPPMSMHGWMLMDYVSLP